MRNLPYRNLFANKKESQPIRQSKDTRRKGNVPRRKSYATRRRAYAPRQRTNVPSRETIVPSRRTLSRVAYAHKEAERTKYPPVHPPNGLLRFSGIIHQIPRPSDFPAGDIYGNRHTRGASQAPAQFTMTISERTGILGFEPQVPARSTMTISARRGLLGFEPQAPAQSTMKISARRTG